MPSFDGEGAHPASATRPIDIPTRETAAFVTSRSVAKGAILEVGCGEGDLAAALMRAGFRVTALDESEDAVARARARGVPAVRATWPNFSSAPIDAVLFTRSLHHIPSLAAAVGAARECLAEKGVLLVEDFAFDQADDRTIEWFLNVVRSPRARALVRPVRDAFVTGLLDANDPAGFWRGDHDHDLHTITAMTEAVAVDFALEAAFEVPYLYRYLVPVLPQTPEAAALVQQVLTEEQGRGASGDIVRIGRRLVAAPRRD